jgi:hypothetical protein
MLFFNEKRLVKHIQKLMGKPEFAEFKITKSPSVHLIKAVMDTIYRTDDGFVTMDYRKTFKVFKNRFIRGLGLKDLDNGLKVQALSSLVPSMEEEIREVIMEMAATAE